MTFSSFLQGDRYTYGHDLSHLRSGSLVRRHDLEDFATNIVQLSGFSSWPGLPLPKLHGLHPINRASSSSTIHRGSISRQWQVANRSTSSSSSRRRRSSPCWDTIVPSPGCQLLRCHLGAPQIGVKIRTHTRSFPKWWTSLCAKSTNHLKQTCDQ